MNSKTEQPVKISIPKKLSQVEEQIKYLHSATGMLNDAFNLLEEKLKLILREEREEVESEKDTEILSESLVGLAQELRHFAVVMEKKKNRLHNIIDRLEL